MLLFKQVEITLVLFKVNLKLSFVGFVCWLKLCFDFSVVDGNCFWLENCPRLRKKMADYLAKKMMRKLEEDSRCHPIGK